MTSNREKKAANRKESENAAWKRKYPKYPPFDVQLNSTQLPSFFGARF